MHASTFPTIFFVLLLIIVLFIACSKKTTPATVPPAETMISKTDKVEQLGKTLFKQDFSLAYNKDKTVVCISKAIKTRPNDIFSTLSFVLYQVESEEILFREAIPKATGKWLNNKEFQVATVPGRMSGRAANIAKSGYVYNVITKTKRPIK